MRKSRFDDVSIVDRAARAVGLIKSSGLDAVGAVRTFLLDGLFWRISALLSDMDAAVERRLPSA